MTENTRVKWSERIGAWKSSGQTAEVFSAGKGFKASTLKYWAYIERRDAKVGAVQMARVEITPPTQAPHVAGSRVTLEMSRSGAKLTVDSDFDDSTLRRVIAILRTELFP